VDVEHAQVDEHGPLGVGLLGDRASQQLLARL
jgi:hypothetical protein